jgi:hypothetical protein
MADIVEFPLNTVPRRTRYLQARVIGAKAGITVRIMSRAGTPHDLLVVLDGTVDGTTTVAAAPASEMDVAEVIAHSVLATLDAADTTWRARETAWSR